MTEIILRVDGTNYAGWKKNNITRSVDQVCHTFELGVTERWKEGAERRPIRAGAAVQVLLGSELLITGHVDDVTVYYDGESHAVTVMGRSLAGDLVDCGLPGQQINGLTLLQVAARLAAPFGINVRADVPVGAAFERVVVEPGETAWDVIERLARQRAVRIISEPSGHLLITRTGTLQVATLEHGVNIMAASSLTSHRERFALTTVVAERPASWADDDPGNAYNSGSATDRAVRQQRTTVMEAEHPSSSPECRERAQWQAAVNAGRGNQVMYTVAGWAPNDAAAAWPFNQRVTVRDEWVGLDNIEAVITTCALVQDDKGRRTELTVMPPSALDLIVEKANEDDEGLERWINYGGAAAQ